MPRKTSAQRIEHRGRLVLEALQQQEANLCDLVGDVGPTLGCSEHARLAARRRRCLDRTRRCRSADRTDRTRCRSSRCARDGRRLGHRTRSGTRRTSGGWRIDTTRSRGRSDATDGRRHRTRRLRGRCSSGRGGSGRSSRRGCSGRGCSRRGGSRRSSNRRILLRPSSRTRRLRRSTPRRNSRTRLRRWRMRLALGSLCRRARGPSRSLGSRRRGARPRSTRSDTVGARITMRFVGATLDAEATTDGNDRTTRSTRRFGRWAHCTCTTVRAEVVVWPEVGPTSSTARHFDHDDGEDTPVAPADRTEAISCRLRPIAVHAFRGRRAAQAAGGRARSASPAHRRTADRGLARKRSRRRR